MTPTSTIRVRPSKGRKTRSGRRAAKLRASSVVVLALGVVFALGASQFALADAPSTVTVDVSASGNTVECSAHMVPPWPLARPPTT